MIDIEKEYQDLSTERENGFISLYDLIVFIKKHNPTTSDNKIATVLLDKFKKYHYAHQEAVYNRDCDFEFTRLFTSEDAQILQLGDLLPYTMPKRLHEPEIQGDFDDLINILENIEDHGIFREIPF